MILLIVVEVEEEDIALGQVGGKAETVTGFIFLGSKITADGDYSHELKDACSLEGKL